MLSLLHGVAWVHVVPAIAAVLVGFLCLKTRWMYLKVVMVIVWFLLLPNTAYLFIDVERIGLHWASASIIVRIALILQYLLLELICLMTYLLAMLPLEQLIHIWHFSKKSQIIAISIVNFCIGFGVVLGRTGYENSYGVFTQPTRVLTAAMHIITSVNLLGVAFAFGILCSFIYFLFRKIFVSFARRYIRW